MVGETDWVVVDGVNVGAGSTVGGDDEGLVGDGGDVLWVDVESDDAGEAGAAAEDSVSRTGSVRRHHSEGETGVGRSLAVLREANGKTDSTNFT